MITSAIQTRAKEGMIDMDSSIRRPPERRRQPFFGGATLKTSDTLKPWSSLL
jgi:hypothetical protein